MIIEINDGNQWDHCSKNFKRYENNECKTS